MRQIIFIISVLYLLFCLPNNINSEELETEEETDENLEEFDISSEKPLKITKETFSNVINQPEHGTFVMFYAPWCGHCKRMVSIWNQLAKRHNQFHKFAIAKVDCTDQTELCSDNDVLAYPTFLFFKRGNPEGASYDGQRTLTLIESFMLNQYELDNKDAEESLNEIAVNELDENNFNHFISKGFHFIKFFAPWCGHCQMLAPTWDQLGKKYLNSKVKISKVDCTKYGIICSSNDVKGYPTLLFFHNGKLIMSYNKQRTIDAFSKFIDDLVQDLDKSNSPDKTNALNSEEINTEGPSGEVLELTNKNFQNVLNKKGYLFVKFYAPWCGHCQSMMQAWKDLALKVEENKKIKIGEVDCTNNVELCTNHNINAYPTLILYKNGDKLAEYTGAREVDSFLVFLNSYTQHDDL